MNIDRSSIEAFLSSWLPSQRWFLAPADTAENSDGSYTDDDERAASINPHVTNLAVLSHTASSTVLFLLVEAAKRLYAVPLIQQNPSRSSAPGAHVYDDASHTPEGRAALLAAALAPGFFSSSSILPASLSSHIKPLTLHGHPLRETFHNLPPIVTSRTLTSEQSNTSMIYELADGRCIIAKLLRLVHPGINPDIELQCALDNAGSAVVPAQYGYARARFSSASLNSVDPLTAENEYEADILTASEFLDGSIDAWQLITSELSASGNFSISAIAQLGAATHTMHTALASALPTADPDDDARAAQLASWRERAAHAVENVPELQQYAAKIECLYANAASLPWPQLQRIHGDFHLGQVLRTHNASGKKNGEETADEWRIIDFEGEPLRPLSERSKPDLALRDIAGMLRSLSYAAGFAVKDGASSALMQEWEHSAREEFLHACGVEKSPLLDALILDKALYEVMYEAVYRPSWLDIPLAGIAEIMSAIA